MDENICCPFLETLDCEDTNAHRHLYCDSGYTIRGFVMTNEYIKTFCLAEFKDCSYYPKGEE